MPDHHRLIIFIVCKCKYLNTSDLSIVYTANNGDDLQLVAVFSSDCPVKDIKLETY